MPICNKPAIPIGSRKGATEIDDHASEAAKLKRAREQAYFNSYNFDAIEVLPSDDEGSGTNKIEEKNQLEVSTKTINTKTLTHQRATNKPQQQQQQISQLPSAGTSSDSIVNIESGSSSNISSIGSGRNNSEKVLSMKYAYLQRLGAFFVSPHESTTAIKNENLQTTKETAGVDNNFSLPRAMLKNQSSNVGASNSMPVTIVTTQQQQQHQLPTNGIGVKILQKDDNKSAATLMTSNTVSLVSAQTQSKPNRDHEDAQTAFLMLQENSNKFPRNKKQSTSSTATTIASIESLEPSSSSNSSAATSTAVVITIDRSANLVNSKKSTTTTATQPPRSSFASTESNDEGTTTLNGRANSHQSHYSTDKSGSSGYYSSNVCSTYSVEDHIYCEPVIGVLDLNGNKKQKRKNLQTEIATTRRLQQQQPIQQLQQQVPTISAAAMNVNGKALLAESHFNSQTLTMNGGNDRNGSDDTEADEDESDGKVLAIRRKLQRRIMPQNFSEKLRILETSIDNLDRHLKNFPSLSSQEHIVSYVQCHQPYMQQQQHESFEKIRLPYNHHLPTIMEGYDPVNQPRPWQDSIADDSLLDIDLDSFLLTNETKEVKRKVNATTAVGIDNPTFITDEVEENNYKCVKYINSCPENAYRVESDIVGSEGHGTASSQKSLTAEHYMRRYEDQLHFQNTRELLEDVRDKIRVLSQSNSDLRSSSNSSELSSHSSKNSNEEKNPTVSRELSNSDDFIEIPKELESMIKTLKHELEIYLDRMNQRSDYEIRQLCSGLVKNEHIVKIKKAFARRHSITQKDYYEAINSDNALVSFKIGVPSNIRQQLASIRCASDPNFKMKRKSLTEVFPTVSCFIETANEQRRTQTQLQRNLSYHKPILNHLSPEVIIKDMNDGKSAGNTESNARKVGGDSGVNALRGTGSGSNSTKSGESGGDKDSILDWHRKKPSIWEQYYGTNRMHQSLLGKRNGTVVNHTQSTMSYPSSRPESDFTLDLPRAEQLRIKMEKEKKFRQRCRFITTFLSLVFFLLTVMVVSLVLTRGKRMFGSMI